ncbi:MAG: Holliday junction resolvase RuvX [Erysipelotrichaceae bacterium]
MRILGLDLGSKTIGVAISDKNEFLASGLTTIRFAQDDYDDGFDQLLELIDEHQIKKIVLGLPKHMNGDIGIRGQLSIDFKENLENERDVEVVLWDERLTTVSATNLLLSADVSRKKRKEVVDKIAAVFILQGYLDSRK